jgi:mannosyltransferase
MAVLGVWGLARQNAMGNDEVATLWAAKLSLRQLFHLLDHVDAVHGLYYLLMHFWVSAFGTTPTIIRIPSVIVMTAAAGLIVIIGRHLTGSAWAGLFAGLIMALTPVVTFYAQTARSYAAVLLCVACATLVLVRALEAEAAGSAGRVTRATRWWVLYGALVTLGGYLNELSLLILGAHAVTVLLARYGRRTSQHWVIAGAVGALLCLPVAGYSIKERGAVGWIPRPDTRDIGILFHDYFGGTTLAAVLIFLCAVAAVLPGKAGPPWWRSGGISLPSVALPWLVVPGAVLIGESLVGKPLYSDRYVLYAEAAAALLAGGGVYRIGGWLAERWGRPAARRAVVVVPGAVVCVCALVLQLGPQQRVRTPQVREFDYGSPSRYIGAHARPGDGVLFFNSFYRKARLGYPADFRNTTDFAMALSPTQAGTFNGTDKPFALVRPLMLTYKRIWVVGRAPSATVSNPAIRAEGELLMTRFRLAVERHYKGIVVTLWIQR